MNHNSANPPIILSFSSLDPSGCGGIQADIETAASLGCHCSPIATGLCSEGMGAGSEVIPVDSTLVIEQARSVLENMDVAAIKIGFLSSTANAEAVHSILRDYDQVPVIAHPALCLWEKDSIEQEDLPQAFATLILPMATVTNYSLYEAREVAQENDTIETTAHALVSTGCDLALITGTGKERQAFQNSLFDIKGAIKHYHWEQEPPTCLGSSSTLSMSVAAYMAHGSDAAQACEQAQNYTWQAMRASRELGFGRRTPHRFYWADKNIEYPSDMPAAGNTH